MLSSEKGISSHQIFRMMKRVPGSDYRTFWFMCHRLRAAMRNEEWPLSGIVEIDELYLGGKNKNRQWNKRQRAGGGAVGKTAVMGAIARKGNVVCQVVLDTTAATTNMLVREMVSEDVTLIATDEGAAYKQLRRMRLPHETVDHKAGEYVRGEVHTNNIENFWSLIKRGVVGTFHNVSADYLPLYLNEFSFRYNLRKHPDAFAQLISSV
jgi:transposase-like protein